MAYVHYWKRPKELPRDGFERAVEDARIIVDHVQQESGVRIAGPTGFGRPELTNETIALNGVAECGHRYRNLGRPFAAENAEGVGRIEPPYDPKKEPYFSGPYLETRVCDGCCAGPRPFGAFVVDRNAILADWEKPDASGMYQHRVETEFKPYDLPVTAILIRLKERLGEKFKVSTENPGGFEDGKRLCRELFGFGVAFQIENKEDGGLDAEP
jgi:hypothetical protein